MQILIPSILKINENEMDLVGYHLKGISFSNIAIFYSSGIDRIYGERIEIGLKKYGINILHKLTIDEIKSILLFIPPSAFPKI
jgi:hypothetical protein